MATKKNSLTKTKSQKINKILSKTFCLDKESCMIIVDCLNAAIYRNDDYFKFNLRNLMRSIDDKYMLGVAHMEKHLSSNINQSWCKVDTAESYASLGLLYKPTPKVLVMLLLEKLQRNEL